MKKLIIILLLLTIGGGFYLYFNNDSNKNLKVDFIEDANKLSVLINGNDVQSIELEPDAIKDFDLIKEKPDAKRFITDMDVNYDGQNDVGVFVSTGYAGVNYFYDFYIYNFETQRLEKSEYLVGISNPEIEIRTRQITSTYKSGQDWYKKIISFDTVDVKDNYKHKQYVISDPIALTYKGITIEKKGLENICTLSNEDYTIDVEATIFGGIKFGALDPKVLAINHLPEGGIIFSEELETTICPKVIKENKIYFEEWVYDSDLDSRIYLLDLDNQDKGIQETEIIDINSIK